MTGKIRYVGFAFLAALLALGSCRDLDKDPVFYTLSQEEPLGDDLGFPDESSVFKMVKITVGGTDDYYLAAAGRLYIRGIGTSDNWTAVAPPTGLANVIVHAKLAERQREALLGSRLLGVLGVLQREGEVVHLIAKRLVDHSELLGRLAVESRDFC